MNESDLEKLGYRRSPDGSFSRPERVPDAVAQPAAGPALDHAPQGEGQGQAGTVVRITRRACRLLDVDNGFGGCKPLVDQLRYAGLIQDDDPQTIELQFRQEKVRTKAEEGTSVEIIQGVLTASLNPTNQ